MLRTTIARAAIATSLGAALLLTGCGGGGSSTTSDAGSLRADTQSQAKEGAGADLAAPGSVATGGAAAPRADAKVELSPVSTGQMLARTATVSLRVKDLEAAASGVRSLALGAGGQVASERLSAGAPRSSDGADLIAPGLSGTITIQVPGARLDEVLAGLAKVGTVVNRSVTSEDVKARVVDTESRLKTMRESVARVRALMGQATKLSDIVSLESELSTRQADLEALESQLADLKGSVAMSPVTISLERLSAVDEQPVEEEDNAFVAGLRNGWKAFAAAFAILLTILGSLLPFAMVAALFGIPLVLWLRRRRNSAHAPASTGDASPPAAATT